MRSHVTEENRAVRVGTRACGADAKIIASRNLARQVAAGVAAHSDHGRDVCHALLLTAQGKAEGYEIKDTQKLRRIAEEWNIDVAGRSDTEIAVDVAQTALNMWNQDAQPLYMYTRTPEGTRERWQQLVTWFENSPYRKPPPYYECLEELLSAPDAPVDDYVFDLFLPIAE